MASLEKINFDGRTELGVNVSGIVGYAGKNYKDDVLLIQGLFNYIAKGLNRGAIGLDGLYKIPEITGEMDGETYSAIGEFQIRNAHQLLMNSYDGRIHPANYRNRSLHSTAGHFMSITLLHIMAIDAALMNGSNDYTRELASLNSELARVIDLAIIKS